MPHLDSPTTIFRRDGEGRYAVFCDDNGPMQYVGRVERNSGPGSKWIAKRRGVERGRAKTRSQAVELLVNT